MDNKQPEYKPLCLITACLEAARIQYRMDLSYKLSLNEYHHHFVVQKLDGQELHVRVSDGAPVPGVYDVSLQVLNKGDAVAINELIGKLMIEAGYKPRQVIDRGAKPPVSPGRKSARPYGDDADRVIMRETLFRKVPNPTPKVYQDLDKVIMTCVRFFYNANRKLCLRLGYEIHDMKSYAQVWTANFWATSRVLTPKDENENQKLLYRFLRQRFAEFYRQMVTFRTRNVLVSPPEEDLVVTRAYGQNIGEYVQDVVVSRETDVLLPEEKEEREENIRQYQEDHTELDVTTYKKRRDSAVSMLKSGLESMDHDQMVDALTEVCSSWFHCPDTRKEAERQLKLHRAACLTCAKRAALLKQTLVAENPLGDSAPVSLDVGEDLSIVDSGGDLERAENALAA